MDARSKSGRKERLKIRKQSQSLGDSQLVLLNSTALHGVAFLPDDLKECSSHCAHMFMKVHKDFPENI